MENITELDELVLQKFEEAIIKIHKLNKIDLLYLLDNKSIYKFYYDLAKKELRTSKLKNILE